jgi:parallel beta-helix repeat protein
MASYNNIVSGNTITGRGSKDANEGGIFVHALCYDNKISDNQISGTAEGVGTYYGASGNKFYNNIIKNVRVGIISFYARNNDFSQNDVSIQTQRKGNPVGALVFGSKNVNVSNNTIGGNILFGVQLQASSDYQVADNRIRGLSSDKYSFGIKVIGNKKNQPSANNANSSMSARSMNGTNKEGNGQLKNNQIEGVKTKISND